MDSQSSFFVRLVREWRKDDVTHLAAAVAYYAMFSFPSLLLLIIAAGGALVGDELIRQEVFTSIDRYVAGEAGAVLKDAIAGITAPGRGLLMTILGVVGLIIGGTGIIRETQTALRKMCGIRTQGKRDWLMQILKAFLGAPALSILLVVALTASAAFSAAQEHIARYVSLTPSTLGIASSFLSLLTLTMFLWFLYVSLLPRKIPSYCTIIGAFSASVLLILSKSFISVYVAIAHLGAAYGVAASMLVLLLWTYVSAVIFLTGAEIAVVVAGLEDEKA